MYTLLMLATAAAAAAFLVTLLLYVFRITETLDQIGGRPDSLLSKLRLGLQAIEGETAHLPPMLGRLNEMLGGVAGGLSGAAAELEGTVAAALRQEEKRT